MSELDLTRADEYCVIITRALIVAAVVAVGLIALIIAYSWRDEDAEV